MILTYTVLHRFNLLLNSLITILKLIKVTYAVPCLILPILLLFPPLSFLFLPLLPFLVLHLLLYFSLALSLKSFQLFPLPFVLFLFFLVLVCLTCATTNMCSLILILDIAFTLSAFVGFVTAHLEVVSLIGYLDRDATKLAVLWLESTIVIMILVSKLGCLEIAIDTC